MATASYLEPSSTKRLCGSSRVQDGDRTSEDVIREWVARFAINCGQPPSEARVLLWIDELSDIEPDRLEAAFRAVLRSHTFNSIPQVGEIRAQIKQADSNARDIEAALAWDKVLRFVDCSVWSGIVLTTKERRAANLVRAFDRIEHCDTDEDLDWIRKEYLKSYARVCDLEENEYLLPEGEARKLLCKLGAASKEIDPKQLQRPAATPTAPIAPGNIAEPLTARDLREIRADLNALRATLPEKSKLTDAEIHAEAKRVAALTEEELISEAKNSLPPAQFEHWLRMHEHAKQLRAEESKRGETSQIPAVGEPCEVVAS